MTDQGHTDHTIRSTGLRRETPRSGPLANAASAKGLLALINRVRLILQRYGLTPRKIECALDVFARTLKSFDCGATFPTTAIAVQRHPHVLASYQALGIEFIIHGYHHIDYAALAPEAQRTHLARAREIFAAAQIEAVGFRSPYLRREAHLYTALRDAGFAYVSDQPVLWDVLDLTALSPESRARYERAIAYYAPWDAGKRVSTPRLLDGLIEIPVSLPDDEILIDRLGSAPDGLILDAWPAMLAESYRRGELLTLQLHPERSAVCAQGLAATLRQARDLAPAVWCVRLDQIAAWWTARAAAVVTLTAAGPGVFRVAVNGPEELTMLARNVAVDAPTLPWADGYRQVVQREFPSGNFTVHAARRPCVGVSAATDAALTVFLQAQGYLVEPAAGAGECALYLDRPAFAPDEELALLDEIETRQTPLVRLGRWPRGYRSTLAITGDIDAFTLWDYGLRLFGH